MNIGIDAHRLGHNKMGSETYIVGLIRTRVHNDSSDTFNMYAEKDERSAIHPAHAGLSSS